MKNNPSELSQCLTKLVGKTIHSPRRVFSDKRNPQDFTVVRLDEESQKMVIRFDSGTLLNLPFWRFNLVYSILKEANGEYVAIGARLDPEEGEDTIESRLHQEARKMTYPSASTKTAPHVCDLFVVCGFAQYGTIENPKTGRRVQAIHMSE